MSPYFAYLVRCADGTFYAGICTDTERRVAEHNGPSKGARYTKARQPVILAYREECADRPAALRREYALKRLKRSEKESLAAGWKPL